MRAHLTTVHARTDSRIFVKEVQTLRSVLSEPVVLVVADGKGGSGSNGDGVIDLGVLPGGRAAKVLQGTMRAFRTLRALRVRSVHFHDPELIPLGLLLRLLGHQVIYDAHEDLPNQILSKHWIPRLLRYPTAWAMAAAEWIAGRAFQAVVAATPTIAARFPADKRVLVQNFPIPDELLVGTPRPYDARPSAFVYLGGVAAIRGAHEMVDAVARLRHVPGLRLHLAGRPDRTGLLDDLARRPGWDLVTYHGVLARREVAGLLSLARAGLVPLHALRSYMDAQPVKMFEYMAAGLPVIASDFPLWREIIAGADCGILVDPYDPAAIAAAMEWVLSNPAAAEAMGQRGRQAILERYSWQGEGAALVALYQRLGAEN